MPDDSSADLNRTSVHDTRKQPRVLSFSLKGGPAGQRFELREGTSLVVGRALTSDLPVVHPTVSRRHAELRAHPESVEVIDLGSSNGTFLNGVRVERAHARAGDTIRFGTCEFELTAQNREASNGSGPAAPRRMLGGQTVRHERRLTTPTRAELALERTPGEQALDLRRRVPGADAGRMALKLSLLLEVSKALSGTFDLDLLLQRVVDFAFQLLEVDRVALLLMRDGELVPQVTREAAQGKSEDTGDATGRRAVPRSIVEHAVQERIAILSDDAPADVRFGGDSVVLQKIQSVMCVPLLGHGGDVLGVLYVDNRSAAYMFEESDLDFLVAFAGIAAVAMENTSFAERLRREAVVRSSFERFFNPSLAARIAADPQAVRLGGERRRVAVLFADIRGFTPRAESMPPEEVAALLNEYFTRMVECVFRHGGTLDKFIGDALMAQWGAPIARSDDADAALRAALDMQDSVRELNAEWKRAGREPLEVGIGINVGDAFAGHIGSERRLEYTVIGDTVNVASRVCGIAAAGEILITANAAESLTTNVSLEPGEPLVLRGKSQPVPVFRVER
jgi:adenylate cyclase